MDAEQYCLSNIDAQMQYPNTQVASIILRRYIRMRAKRPTLAQKKLIEAAGLKWETWNVVSEDEKTIVLMSKKSKKKRTINK